MKNRILASLFAALFFAMAASAQVDPKRWVGKMWTDGVETYSAFIIDKDKVALAGTGFFESDYGTLFKVTKTAPYTYTLKPISPKGVNLSEKPDWLMLREPVGGITWQRKMIDGVDVILQSSKGQIKNAYIQLSIVEDMARRVSMGLKTILAGDDHDIDVTYTTASGERYTFNPSGTCELEGKSLKFTIGTQGPKPVNVIVLSDGRELMFEPTMRGINLYTVLPRKAAAAEAYQKDRLYKSLTASSDTPRWPFLSKLAIDRVYSCHPPQVLRLMRNEIYARKGYVFGADDLDSYFRSCGWYKPLGNNSKVKLSQIEQLNVALLNAFARGDNE